MSRSMWTVLGLSATTDQTEIRRAYARELKKTNPEDDPEGFQALRQAYDAALAHARHRVASHEPVAMTPMEPTAPRDAARPSVQAAPGDLFTDETVFEESERLAREMAAARAERDAEFAVLDEACRLLREALTGETAPDPADIEQRGRALLALPAMDDLGTFAQVDHWLSDLAARTIPRSDPLLEIADYRFGWHTMARQAQPPPAVEHLLSRLEDLGYRSRIQRKSHGYFKAFRFLQAPPRPKSIVWRARAMWLARDVLSLWRTLEQTHRTIFADFDEASLTWWRAYLSAPRMTPVSLGWIAGLSLLGLFAGGAQFGGGTGALLGAVITGAGAAGVAFGLHYGVAVARHRWLRDWQEGAPDWIRFGWAPAGLATLLIAALLPPHIAVTVAAGVFSIGVFGWARAVAQPQAPGLSHSERFGPLVFLNLFLGATVFLMVSRMPPLQGVQLALPLFATAAAFARHRQSLGQFWRDTSPLMRNRVLALLYVAVLAGAALLSVSHDRPVIEGLVVALSGTAVLLQRPAAAGYDRKLEERMAFVTGGVAVAVIVGATITLQAYTGPIGLIIGALVLLGSAAASGGVAAFRERKAKP